ncbi:Lrp/AsnC family transcriptional regulator [Chloroflexota bacterium]
MSRKSRGELDNFDLMLIKELEGNARISYTELARKIGTSRATVARKLQRLIDGKFIDIVAITKPRKIGYRVMALIGLKVFVREIDRALEALSAYEDILFVASCTGPYDIIIWSLFKESDDLYNFLSNDLRKIPGVWNTDTIIPVRIKKRTYGSLEAYEGHEQSEK